MKFALITVALAGLAAAAPAVPVQEREVQMEKRQWATLVSALSPKVVSGLVGAVVGTILGNQKRDTAAWSARGDLAQYIVDGMKELDASPEEAAVCAVHNGYVLSDESHQRELSVVEMSDGPKKTYYDCFFLGGPSTLTLNVTNTPLNVVVQAGPCSWKNSVLTCP